MVEQSNSRTNTKNCVHSAIVTATSSTWSFVILLFGYMTALFKFIQSALYIVVPFSFKEG
ncbi:hypothetical protein [Gracilibacillus salinarum]|uniref:Uncharacterized protein n=1 Tax=Gracilibacillus salinarum TaxID=2932255 RepID=A0ABY4GKS1_9BACI|nr:hypothetical protein [Gracilibacillus salinarum]UOQ84771.1 hypothetical protein MUN87_19280 [Gracilibacillus salinarum]